MTPPLKYTLGKTTFKGGDFTWKKRSQSLYKSVF